MPSVVKTIKERNVMNVKNTGHTLISFVLNLLGIGIMLYIGIKYYNDPNPNVVAFTRYAFLLAGFGVIGFFTIDYFDNRQINIKPKRFNEFDTTRFIMVAGVLFIISMYVDFILKVTIKYALSDIDQVMFYVFSGVCEEAFFRAFLINMILGVTTKKGQKPRFFVIVTAVLLSSVAFMSAHLVVYGSNMPMLISTLVGGIILGSFYVIFRDIAANMLAHSLKNAVGYVNLVRFG
ncbi:hypothetical protein LCGC14_1047170 [marine sediment metagenome]|uniref:CAAX prenyl protease 2/Lysostaphin resistance protein A-like domain-containing protein n=1 Tax=marine sediment metagenome TaxID=412755 RepID=A0A0F9Q854_9ZZZZ